MSEADQPPRQDATPPAKKPPAPTIPDPNPVLRSTVIKGAGHDHEDKLKK